METVLLIPEYANEIRGSILQITQSLLYYASTRDDVHLVVPYPKEGSRWKNWTPEKWGVQSDNIEFVPVLMDKYSECAMGRVSSDWANSKFGGRQDFSVVATMRSTSPVGIRRLFAKPMAGFYPEVVNMYLLGDYFASLPKGLPEEILFNFVHSWNILYGTEGFRELMRKRMSQLFTPAVWRKIQDKTVNIHLGVHLDKMKSIQPMEKKEGTIRIAYGGRLSPAKGVQDYIEFTDELYSSGYNVETGFYFVFDRWREDEDKIKGFRRPYTRVEINATPVETNFFAYAASSDFFFCTSKYESSGLSFTELLMLGVPGLFLNVPWVKGLVPDDYPYVYNSKADMLLAARTLCNRLQKGEPLAYDMSKVKKFIEEHHDRRLCEKATIDLLVNLSLAKKNKQKVDAFSNLLS